MPALKGGKYIQINPLKQQIGSPNDYPINYKPSHFIRSIHG